MDVEVLTATIFTYSEHVRQWPRWDKLYGASTILENPIALDLAATVFEKPEYLIG